MITFGYRNRRKLYGSVTAVPASPPWEADEGERPGFYRGEVEGEGGVTEPTTLTYSIS